MSFKETVLNKLDKLDAKVNQQNTELAVYNRELADHTRRTLILEERVKPLEQSHVFWNKLSKAIFAIAAFIAACASSYNYFFK